VIGVILLKNRNSTTGTRDVDPTNASIVLITSGPDARGRLTIVLCLSKSKTVIKSFFFTGKKCSTVFNIETHAVVALTFANRIARNNCVSDRIYCYKLILVLQVDVYLARHRIVLGMPVSLSKCNVVNNLSLTNINDGFRLASFI